MNCGPNKGMEPRLMPRPSLGPRLHASLPSRYAQVVEADFELLGDVKDIEPIAADAR